MRITKEGLKRQRQGGWAASTTAIVVGLIGAATSAAAAVSSGQAAKANADFNSQVAKNNAAAAEQQAAADAQLVAKQNRRVRGAQIAAMSAAGLDPNSASAGDVQYDSAVSGELNRLTTLYKGKVMGANYNAQAQSMSMQGESAATSGYMNAGASILSGAAQAYSTRAMALRNPTMN